MNTKILKHSTSHLCVALSLSAFVALKSVIRTNTAVHRIKTVPGYYPQPRYQMRLLRHPRWHQ